MRENKATAYAWVLTDPERRRRTEIVMVCGVYAGVYATMQGEKVLTEILTYKHDTAEAALYGASSKTDASAADGYETDGTVIAFPVPDLDEDLTGNKWQMWLADAWDAHRVGVSP